MPNRQYGNAYNLFLLVLTVVSLVVMVLLWLPLGPETIDLLRTYDNVICCIFLLDFLVALKRARSTRSYVIDERGWLDLLGSIPTFGVEGLGLLRLARLSRLRGISRRLGRQSKSQLIGDLLRNRAQYAVLTTSLAAFLVMATGSIIVLEAESRSPSGNIRTGADAFWWAIVTLTTVGYGDHFPTTPVGRIAAMFVMVTGLGIIASLASIMARALVDPPADNRGVSSHPGGTLPAALERKLDSLAAELTASRNELAAVRRLLDRNGAELNVMDASPPRAPHPQTPAPTPHSPDR